MMDTLTRAHGRWGKILPEFLPREFLVPKRKGPCPLCGGKDRFRYDDKYGDGNAYCNQCGSMTGYHMVREFKKWDAKTALNAMDRIIGLGDVAPTRMDNKPKNDPATREYKTKRLIERSTHPRIVETYLRHRGLTVSSPVLLGYKDLAFYKDGDASGNVFKYADTVIAPIIAADGKLESVLRIYTDETIPKKERKKTTTAMRTINGGAVRLFPNPVWEMGVAEGVENALAAYELFQVETWAAINANNLELFCPPEGIFVLHVYGDNDKNFVGQRAAYILAHKLHKIHNAKDKHGLSIEVHVPPVPGTDWLDVLTGRGDPA